MEKIEKTIDNLEGYIKAKPTRCGFALICEDLGDDEAHLSTFVAYNGDVDPARQVEMYAADFLRLLKEDGIWGQIFVESLRVAAEVAIAASKEEDNGKD